MKRLILSGIVMIALQFLSASDKPDPQESIRVLEQAVAKTNIFELPSFVMKARIEVEMLGKPFDGSYELLWNGPDHWREEVALQGYHEIQIGGKGVVWVQRNSDHVTIPVFNLHRALGFGSSAGFPPIISLVRFDVTAKDAVTKTHHRKDHGEKLTCFEIETESGNKREICVRESTGILDRVTFQETEANLKPVEGKVFPRVLSYLDEWNTGARVNITEIVTGTQFAPETFTPPAGVSSQPGCMNPMPARLVNKQTPEYPSSARARHIQGKTATYVTIGLDGVPVIGKGSESPSPELDAASVAAIRRWRFDPALCGDKPVEMETVVEVKYTLSN